jgi:hypothetical protein
MPRRPGAERQPADSGVAEFLLEFARLLIAAGLPYPRFAALVRLAYFRAASSKAKFGNERLNQSAVAAMTGLTRVEVRQFAKQGRLSPPKTRDRLEALIEGWITDPSFLTANNHPRKLRMKGGNQSFEALVRHYGGDIPSRSVLRELQRHGYVVVRAGYISINRSANQSHHEVRLMRASRALAGLLCAPGGRETPRAPIRTVSLEASYPPTSSKGRATLHRRIVTNLQSFLASVETAGTAASIDSPSSEAKKGRVTRTRVVMITEDVGR